MISIQTIFVGKVCESKKKKKSPKFDIRCSYFYVSDVLSVQIYFSRFYRDHVRINCFRHFLLSYRSENDCARLNFRTRALGTALTLATIQNEHLKLRKKKKNAKMTCARGVDFEPGRRQSSLRTRARGCNYAFVLIRWRRFHDTCDRLLGENNLVLKMFM